MQYVYHELSEITPHLYLSSALAANEKNVKKFGISTVVTAAKELFKQPVGDGVEVIQLDVSDTPKEDLSKYFEQISTVIKESKERNEKVLVHCMAGVSRSATLCIAYLMRHEGYTFNEAMIHVKCRRSIVRPNLGFIDQLKEWEKEVLS